ncbi:MAG TPA: thiol:disulfide interchange protein DsbA/DsbL, partial [Pseudomonadales bacterium]|nr:thiol:disulfide interchange protein DsbA/DsbL [Pseudomonadales bacterium]
MKTLLLAILLAATAITSPASFAESSGRTLVPGIDYTEIENGKPLDPADGKVVVEEFFNYICPACDHFEPLFASWAARLPPWVKVAHVPAAFSAGFHEYAKAYYAADALGLVDKTHEAVYNAIHNTHKLPGEGQKVDDKAIAAFYANYGVSADKFLSTMNSFSVDSQVRRATDHLKACKVMSTPSLVIDGRYLVKGRNYNDMLWIARALIEKEH